MKLSLKSLPPQRVLYGTTNSPAGKLLVGVTETGQICRTAFLHKKTVSETLAEWQAQWKKTEFVSGANVKNIDKKPILLVGTDFQQQVWRTMVKIPLGRALSYGDVAQKIGKKGAARAVGTACGSNPVPYLVPCHRILAANNKLGGFSSGLDIKRLLLKKEGVNYK